MAFVVETGAGLSNANSYASVSAADSYVADRGITGWTALTETIKQQSLVKATDYLEATYRAAWKGNRVSETQSLSWPRYNVIVDGFNFPSNVVPTQVVNACIEMAIRASVGETLLADQGQRVRREKIDVIEVEYQDYSDPTQRYPLVNRMVMPYLLSASESGFAVVRPIRT
jgi:hypothetical protein